MIETILPASVSVAESTGALSVPTEPSFAAEEALLGRATAHRRAEFVAARACGRAALARLGVPPAPILRHPGGGPRWPAGVVGSITHCAGYRAAATGWQDRVHSIGIDAEPHRPLRPGLLPLITSTAERAQLAELHRSASQVCWDRLLFSAKESIYKLWFPLTNRWLDFADAEVTFIPETDRFSVRLKVPIADLAADRQAALRGLTGRWLVVDGLALTGVAIAENPSAPT
ncbi:MAG TPA: 4'-phosphopantetheinyl transferase superfamily protein [Pseudonocardiaceae bacterium]|jgi:4'-phosphopantetheinyl transferase EntD|nr:4'-phosphopantetheinyl transferase superfamily protein [Pseudonocardiaceae bacterium]